MNRNNDFNPLRFTLAGLAVFTASFVLTCIACL